MYPHRWLVHGGASVRDVTYPSPRRRWTPKHAHQHTQEAADVPPTITLSSRTRTPPAFRMGGSCREPTACVGWRPAVPGRAPSSRQTDRRRSSDNKWPSGELPKNNPAAGDVSSGGEERHAAVRQGWRAPLPRTLAARTHPHSHTPTTRTRGGLSLPSPPWLPRGWQGVEREFQTKAATIAPSPPSPLRARARQEKQEKA